MRRSVASVVWNVRSGVEKLIDSVPTICLVDCASVLFRFRLNDGSKIAE